MSYEVTNNYQAVADNCSEWSSILSEVADNEPTTPTEERYKACCLEAAENWKALHRLMSTLAALGVQIGDEALGESEDT